MLEFISPFSIGGLPFPYVALATFFWFWRISPSSRLVLAVVLGFLLEIFHTFPPGTYLMVFLIEVFLLELIKVYFSDTKDSAVKGASFFIMMASFPLLVILVSLVTGKISGERVHWEGVWLGVVSGGLFWSLLSAAFITGLGYFKRR